MHFVDNVFAKKLFIRFFIICLEHISKTAHMLTTVTNNFNRDIFNNSFFIACHVLSYMLLY